MRFLPLIHSSLNIYFSQSFQNFLNKSLFSANSLSEHPDSIRLVINTIKDLDPARKCYRLIGGVLVERTIKEVLPAVERNLQGINQMIKQLSDHMKKKQTELDDFMEKYNIKPARQLQNQIGIKS
mmetsp:Transcript_43770/g.70354  ORF Transcript_43770/g.70354 Transcript_43770/m.70354 type:complete len:125 (+) Transcript_43770:187-561(+)